jgi:Flp pilus assembly protein TadD
LRSAFRAAAILLGGLLLGGCASGQTASLGGRLVRPGEPALELGEAAAAADVSGAVRKASVESQPRQATSGRTIEDADARLAAALLVEAALPSADSHIRVAEEYRRLGVLDVAFERLSLAVEKEPRLATAHEAIARAWRDWHQPERALGAAHRATYLAGASSSAHNTLGTVFDALGQFDRARDAYSRAVLLDPTAAWALNNLCYVEFRLGRLGEARWQCEAALRLDPRLSAARNNLALIHAASGDLVRARAEFLAAGDRAAAYYNLGIIALARGDHVAAAEAFEEAIRARPTFTAAKERAHVARLRVITGSN